VANGLAARLQGEPAEQSVSVLLVSTAMLLFLDVGQTHLIHVNLLHADPTQLVSLYQIRGLPVDASMDMCQLRKVLEDV